MRILGIETSCDETAAAIVEDGRRIYSNVVASQVEIHAQYGGIVPEVASRQHIIWITKVVEQAMTNASAGWSDVDAIAVTYGPGLAGSLMVGVNVAKALAFARNLPLIPVNHLAGHVYAGWLYDQGPLPGEPEFPLLCLIVSGAHSDLTLMTGHNRFRRIARTRDDAAGEAFDKVARILGLGYPGGPVIQKAAESGRPDAFPVPRSVVKDSLDFSFSGIKTAMLRLVESFHGEPLPVEDLSASFQDAVVDTLVRNTVAAAYQHGVKHILLGGGVAANSRLRERLREASPVPVSWPRPALCTDNGAMIASAGFYAFLDGARADFTLDAKPSLKLGIDN